VTRRDGAAGYSDTESRRRPGRWKKIEQEREKNRDVRLHEEGKEQSKTSDRMKSRRWPKGNSGIKKRILTGCRERPLTKKRGCRCRCIRTANIRRLALTKKEKKYYSHGGKVGEEGGETIFDSTGESGGGTRTESLLRLATRREVSSIIGQTSRNRREKRERSRQQ